jgi:hypothetical protein
MPTVFRDRTTWRPAEDLLHTFPASASGHISRELCNYESVFLSDHRTVPEIEELLPFRQDVSYEFATSHHRVKLGNTARHPPIGSATLRRIRRDRRTRICGTVDRIAAWPAQNLRPAITENTRFLIVTSSPGSSFRSVNPQLKRPSMLNRPTSTPAPATRPTSGRLILSLMSTRKDSPSMDSRDPALTRNPTDGPPNAWNDAYPLRALDTRSRIGTSTKSILAFPSRTPWSKVAPFWL